MLVKIQRGRYLMAAGNIEGYVSTCGKASWLYQTSSQGDIYISNFTLNPYWSRNLNFASRAPSLLWTYSNQVLRIIYKIECWFYLIYKEI